MTLDEYMDPKKFPLTTQRGLKPRQQLLIDAANYDDYKQDLERGKMMTLDEVKIGAELTIKNEGRPAVLQELSAAKQ